MTSTPTEARRLDAQTLQERLTSDDAPRVLDVRTPAEFEKRKKAWKAPELPHQTPWQELQRMTIGQLQTGACLDFAVKYQRIAQIKGLPRDNH